MKFEGVCFQKELLPAILVPFLCAAKQSVLNVCDIIFVKHRIFRHNCVICDGSPNFDISPNSLSIFIRFSLSFHCVYVRM